MRSENMPVRIDKEVKELVDLAERQGWGLKVTTAGRIEFLSPDKTVSPVLVSPRSNGRGLKNALAALQRAGLDVSSTKPTPRAKPGLVEAPQTDEVVDVTKNPVSMKQLIDAYQISESPAMRAALLAVEERTQSGDNRMEDLSTALYITRIMDAAASLLESTVSPDHPCVVCREDAAAQVEKAETLYLESQVQLETAEKRIAKLEGELSRLGASYQEAKTGETEALERAVKAENRLRTLRTALSDD